MDEYVVTALSFVIGIGLAGGIVILWDGVTVDMRLFRALLHPHIYVVEQKLLTASMSLRCIAKTALWMLWLRGEARTFKTEEGRQWMALPREGVA